MKSICVIHSKTVQKTIQKTIQEENSDEKDESFKQNRMGGSSLGCMFLSHRGKCANGSYSQHSE